MKKGLIIFGLVLIVAGAGFPFFKGIILERVIRQSVEQINLAFDDGGQDIKIEILMYERQYSDSIIEWKLRTGSLNGILGVEEVFFFDHVRHGVIKIISTTSLEKNSWFKKIQNQRPNGKNPIKITTEYSLSGDIKSKIELTGFFIKDKKDEIQIKPGTFNVEFKQKLKQTICELNWEGFVIPGKQQLARLHFVTQMDKVSDIIWSGKTVISADSIITNDENHSFEIKNLNTEFSVGFQKASATVSIGITADMDHLSSRQLDIKNAVIQFDIKHLDAKGFENLIKKARIKARLTGKIRDMKNDPNAVKKEVQALATVLGREMITGVDKFLRKGLEISISGLHAQLPQGEINADIVLGLKKSMTLPGFLPILLRPSYVMNIFSLKSDIQIPYTLSGYQKRLLLPLIPGMQTGLFVTQGENLLHKAYTREGKLFLNQKEVELE